MTPIQIFYMVIAMCAVLAVVFFAMEPTAAHALAWSDMDTQGTNVKSAFETWGAPIVLFIGLLAAVIAAPRFLGVAIGIAVVTVVIATLIETIA